MNIKKYAIILALIPVTINAEDVDYTEDTNQVITSEFSEAPVEINGKVVGNYANKVSVIMPSKIGFMVDESGNFTGTNLNVENTGSSDIRVSVIRFSQDKQDGVTLKICNEVKFNKAKLPRNHIGLVLEGALLSSDGSFATSVDLKEIEVEQNQNKYVGRAVLDVKANSESKIKLTGAAGAKSADSNKEASGSSPSYTVVFKVSRKTYQS